MLPTELHAEPWIDVRSAQSRAETGKREVRRIHTAEDPSQSRESTQAFDWVRSVLFDGSQSTTNLLPVRDHQGAKQQWYRSQRQSGAIQGNKHHSKRA